MLDLFPFMSTLSIGSTLKEMENLAGRELGVVRISLGLVSDWEDCERIVKFCKDIVGNADLRRRMSEGWKDRIGESYCKD
jgi:molybdenum cofactor sulfurtransferase